MQKRRPLRDCRRDTNCIQRLCTEAFKAIKPLVEQLCGIGGLRSKKTSWFTEPDTEVARDVFGIGGNGRASQGRYDLMAIDSILQSNHPTGVEHQLRLPAILRGSLRADERRLAAVEARRKIFHLKKLAEELHGEPRRGQNTASVRSIHKPTPYKGTGDTRSTPDCNPPLIMLTGFL